MVRKTCLAFPKCKASLSQIFKRPKQTHTNAFFLFFCEKRLLQTFRKKHIIISPAPLSGIPFHAHRQSHLQHHFSLITYFTYRPTFSLKFHHLTIEG